MAAPRKVGFMAVQVVQAPPHAPPCLIYLAPMLVQGMVQVHSQVIALPMSLLVFQFYQQLV